MSRYFFHLHECGDVTPDEEGLECSNLEAVRAYAIKCARDVMVGEVAGGRLCLSCAIKVHDEADQLVMTVPFREALVVYGT